MVVFYVGWFSAGAVALWWLFALARAKDKRMSPKQREDEFCEGLELLDIPRPHQVDYDPSVLRTGHVVKLVAFMVLVPLGVVALGPVALLAASLAERKG